jgi:hypothetical protein
MYSRSGCGSHALFSEAGRFRAFFFHRGIEELCVGLSQLALRPSFDFSIAVSTASRELLMTLSGIGTGLLFMTSPPGCGR